MKYIFLFIVSIIFSIRAHSQPQRLRGGIITYYYQQTVPLQSAKVDLYFFDYNRPPGYQWVLIATTYTDAYGFYYFSGIYPNAYTIWVNQTKSYNIQVGVINYQYYMYQDLPQFIF